MDRRARHALAATGLVVVATLAGAWLWLYGVPGANATPGPGSPERAVVTVLDEDGTTLATVDARVADSRRERIRGLSDADSLANGSGMLFVHPTAGNHSYVMRDMAFPLDIVFVSPCGDCPDGVDGRVTAVHGAPVPPPDAGRLPRYRGRSKWVLEVPRGYAAANGIDAGDHVRIRYANATATERGVPSPDAGR